MSKAEINNHAQKYSQSYRYDINDGKQSSRWSTDFDAMAKKTVIKLLLSKWGILSVEMQKAIEDDQKVYEVDSTEQYSDNQPDVAEAENPFPPSKPRKMKSSLCLKSKRWKNSILWRNKEHGSICVDLGELLLAGSQQGIPERKPV